MTKPSTLIETTDYNSKAPIWLLFGGLFLFLTGIVIQIAIPGLLNTSNTNNPIDIFFENFPKVFVYASTILIAPIIEELGFRAWQLKNTFIKGLAVLISFGYTVSAFGIPVGIVLAIAMAILIYYRPNRKRRLLGVFFTSLLFAGIHWTNYSDFGTRILMLVMILGIGLVMNYITWRFSLIWSILFHCLYNALAIQTFFVKYDAINIHTDTYEISIQQVRDIETIKFSYTENAVTVEADLNTIVDNWIANYDSDGSYFYISSNKTPKFELNVTMKPNAEKGLVLDTLLSTFGYQFDTIAIYRYNLTVPEEIDTLVVRLEGTGSELYEKLDFIVNTMKSIHNIPVFYDKRNAERIVKINSQNFYTNSKEELIKALAQGNINVVKDSIGTIKGIKLVPRE